MKDKSLQSFLKAADKRGLVPQEVAVRFPYTQHEGFSAYTVEIEDKRLYFCFGSDNLLISKQLLSKYD